MSSLKAFYAVPGWMRLLTGGGALVTVASLPLLFGSAPNLQSLLILAAGVFSASIALFGRSPAAGRA